MQSSVIILSQLRVREINSRRALKEVEDLGCITQLDWLLARGDRTVIKHADTFDSELDSQFNKDFAERLADTIYREALNNNQLPCATREERNKQRSS